MNRRPYWPALLNLALGIAFVYIGIRRIPSGPDAGRAPFGLFPYLWLAVAVLITIQSLVRFVRGPHRPSGKNSPRQGYVRDEPPESKAERLKELDQMKQDGLITHKEYAIKRQQILDDL